MILEWGYSIQGDSVEFPDGSRCLTTAFIDGNCGKEWNKSIVSGTDLSESGSRIWQSGKWILIFIVILLIVFFYLRRQTQLKIRNRKHWK